MAISKSDAEGVVKAISGTGLFDMLSKNLSVHDKSHFSRSNALTAMAGGKPSCSYYYKTSSSSAFQSNADPSVTKDRLNPKKDKKSQWKKVEIVSEVAVDASDCANMLCATLSGQSGAQFKQASQSPDSRFVFIRPIPDGYYGKTLRTNSPEVDAEYICVVLSKGPAAQLITHFPADAGYVSRQTDLS